MIWAGSWNIGIPLDQVDINLCGDGDSSRSLGVHDDVEKIRLRGRGAPQKRGALRAMVAFMKSTCCMKYSEIIVYQYDLQMIFDVGARYVHPCSIHFPSIFHPFSRCLCWIPIFCCHAIFGPPPGRRAVTRHLPRQVDTKGKRIQQVTVEPALMSRLGNLM